MQKCPDVVKDGQYKNFGQVLLKLEDVIGMYNKCQARHNALVDYELKKDK